MSKRKRSDVDEVAADSPRKTRVVEKSTNGSKDAKSKAAARQAKSERRSKKNKVGVIPSAVPEPFESDEVTTTTAPDGLATNDDFVSLSEPSTTTTKPDTPSTAKATKPSKPKKNKKSITTNTNTATTSDATTPSNHRFILFIGNLPYTTTTPSLEHHFRSLLPFTVRHSTDKTTKKSKGFAFLEFESYDRMKTCLKLYHHSLFDPDAHLTTTTSSDDPSTTGGKDAKIQKKRLKPSDVPEAVIRKDDGLTPQWKKTATGDKTRRINVELTAGGGGGKSKARKAKIVAKNAKLADERERAHKKEVEEKGEKGPRSGERGGGGGKRTKGGEGAEAEGKGNVHPSRMGRVRG